VLPAEAASLDVLFMNAHTRGVVAVGMGLAIWLYSLIAVGLGSELGNAAGLSVFYSRYDNRRSTRTQLVHVRSSGPVVLAFLIARHPNSCSFSSGWGLCGGRFPL